MKIIDLLNKIANGEIPKTIVYDGSYFTYDDKRQNYFAYDDSEIDWKYTVMEYINDEIEIIEDTPKEEKKIPEKLNLYYHINNDVEEETGETTFNDLCDIIGNLRKHEDTINSIIDYLKSKGE